MRRILVALAVMTASTATIAPIAGFGAPGTFTKSYTAGVIGDAIVECELDPVNLGGACFSLDGSESSVSATIADDLSQSVCAAYSFSDAAGEGGAVVPFANSVEDVAIPSGSTAFNVFTDGPVFATVDCSDPTAIGTTGTITATLS